MYPEFASSTNLPYSSHILPAPSNYHKNSLVRQ